MMVPLLFAVALSAAPGDDVVARVDQVAITRDALARRIQGFTARGGPTAPNEALDTLIVDVLLSQEARRMGLGSSPEVAPFVEREIRTAAAAALVASYVDRRPPDEATVRKMFHATSDFARYESLSYLTKEQAAEALQRLARGSSFAAEARTAIGSRVYAKPSDAPMLMRAQLGRLADPIFAAAPGAIIGPLEEDPGWVVARVLEKQVGSDADFAARRPAVIARLREQTEAAMREHLLPKLKAKEAVKIDEAFLSTVGSPPTQAQLQHVIATVKGTQVRYADVYPSIMALGGRASHLGSGRMKLQFATRVVDEKVLEAFAVEQGFDKAPDVAGQRPELERNILAALAAARIRASAPPPSDREIENHYRQNAFRYGQPLKKVKQAVFAELAEQKRNATLAGQVEQLRKKASVSIAANAFAAGAGN